MIYPEGYDPVGVQLRIRHIKQEFASEAPVPLCDFDSSDRHTALVECTPDNGEPFFRCHKHHPYTL
jgi:hypothetical protein